MQSPHGATGAIQHEGIQIASNTQTADEMRETLGIEAPEPTETAEGESAPAETTAPASDPPPADAKSAVSDPPKQDLKKRERYEALDKERHDLRRENERLKAERQREQSEIGTLRQEFQRELAELKRMARPAEAPKAEQPQTDAEPDPTDLTKYPDGQFDRKYLKDQARWEARQEFTSLQQQAAERYHAEQAQRQQFEREQAERSRIQNLGKKMQQAFTSQPDLQMKLETVALTRPMWDVVLESDRPDQILAYMADHPEKAEEIASLPPLHAFRALSRIEYELDAAAQITGSAAPGKPKTSAHPPVSPVSGSHSAPAGGPPGPNATVEEHFAYYDRLEAEQRKARR